MRAFGILTHYSDVGNPGKLPDWRPRSSNNSVCIRNTADFINFRPICSCVSPNCTIIHQHKRKAPGKRENFLYKQRHEVDWWDWRPLSCKAWYFKEKMKAADYNPNESRRKAVENYLKIVLHSDVTQANCSKYWKALARLQTASNSDENCLKLRECKVHCIRN